MTAWRQAIELSIGDEDVARLVTITRSRTEPASRVERARMLLAYREDPSFFAVAHALGVHHQTVQRCVERALVYGPMAALDDRPRSGKEPTITAEAKACWCRWPAARRRNWAIRTNCGRRDCWLAMRVSTDRRKDTAPPTGGKHGVQENQRARGEAAQGSLLPGTPRSRIQSQDGGGSVHLPRGEDHQGDRGGSEAKAQRCSGDRLL